MWPRILGQRGLVHRLAADAMPCIQVGLCVCSGASSLVTWNTVITRLASMPMRHIPTTTITHVPIVIVFCGVGEHRLLVVLCGWYVWRWDVPSCRWYGGHNSSCVLLVVATAISTTIVASSAASTAILPLPISLQGLLLWVLRRCGSIQWSWRGRSKRHRTYGCRCCRTWVKCHRRHGGRCSIGQAGWFVGLLGVLPVGWLFQSVRPGCDPGGFGSWRCWRGRSTAGFREWC